MKWGALRQRKFPVEFRIPDSYPELPGTKTPEPVPQTSDDPAMADLATNLWRVGKKLNAEQNGDATRGRRLASRHAQAAQESLAEAGVQIQDHDGMPFHPGLSLDVIAYEPRPGTVSETVVETVRPSVYRGGRCIQIGQVIVAQPEGAVQHDA